MEQVQIDILLNSNVAEEGGKASTAIEKMAVTSLKAREEAKKSLELQRTYLKKLRAEYQSVQEQLSRLKLPTKKKNKLQKASNALSRELADEEQALKRLESEWAKMNRGYSEVQQRMRQTREQMKTLSLAGREQTDEYKRLRGELAELSKAQARITRTQSEMAKGNQSWRGLGDAVTAFGGAASAAVGAWTLLGGAEEEQTKIQTKLQSLMAITIGLQQIQNLLAETSTFRIQTVTRAKQLWTSANRALASALNISTASAQALTGALTLGLSVAIGVVINLYEKWRTKQQKAKADQEAFGNAVASHANTLIAKYESLRKAFVVLNDDTKAQTKFVRKNAGAFEELGVKVKSVREAENLLVNNSDAFVQSILLRAKASAAMELASEKYKESIRKMLEADERATTTTFGDRFLTFIANIGLERTGNAPTAKAEEFAKSSASALRTEGENLQKEGDAFIEKALQFGNELDAIFKEAGFTPVTTDVDDALDKSEKAIQKALERLSKLSADAEKEAQEISLSAMREGKAKRLYELDTEYNARKKLVAQKLQEIKEMEEKLGVDGSEATGKLLSLDSALDKDYQEKQVKIEVEYAQVLQEIEGEITLRSATEQEKRLADLDNYYAGLLSKATVAMTSEAELEKFKTRLLAQHAKERELIIKEEELRRMDSEERIALRQAQFSSKQYALKTDREEELLRLQLEYSEKRLRKLQEIEQAGGDATEAIAEAKVEIEELKSSLDQIPVKKLAELGNSLKGIFSNLSSVGGEVGAVFGQLANGVDSIMTSFAKGATTMDKIGGAIGGISQLIGIATETAEQNQRAMDAWQSASIRALQVARMQRIESEAYKESNIWGVENPYARAIAGAKQYAQSMKELNGLANALGNGRVQVGSRKVASAKNIIGGAAGGAAVGAAVGSFIPVIGNAVGAAIGGLLGGIFGATQKKIVPVFESLASKYGKIFNKDTFELNPRILQDYGKLDEATKKLVDNWEAVQKKAKEAQEEMRNTFKDLSENLGQQLSNALVEGFKNDDLYKAMDDFDRKVSEMIHGIVQQMVFSQHFQKYFDELQKRMENSFGERGDGSIVDDIIWFSKKYREGVDAYSEAMKEAQNELKKQGFDVPENLAGRRAAAKGIARADQDSIDDLNGRMTVVVDRLNTLVLYRKESRAFESEVKLFQSALLRQMDKIAEHTEFLKRLANIERDIFAIRQEGLPIKR